MTGFFFPFFVTGLILKTKPWQDVVPRSNDFFKLVLYQLFHFRQESYDDFLKETVLPIFPISPHDVISFLHLFGQQDKKNGR